MLKPFYFWYWQEWKSTISLNKKIKLWHCSSFSTISCLFCQVVNLYSNQPRHRPMHRTPLRELVFLGTGGIHIDEVYKVTAASGLRSLGPWPLGICSRRHHGSYWNVFGVVLLGLLGRSGPSGTFLWSEWKGFGPNLGLRSFIIFFWWEEENDGCHLKYCCLWTSLF